MIRDFVQGFTAYFSAIGDIGKYKLWKYVIMSGLVSLSIGTLIVKGCLSLSYRLADWLVGFYKWDFGKSIIDTASDYIVAALLISIALLLFKYVVMVVVSPFMSLISEAIESKDNQEYAKQGFTLSGAISDIIRGLRIATRNLSRELFFTLVIIIIGLFPLTTIVAPVLLFSVQAYYAGFGNMDYLLERHYRVAGSARFVRDNRWLAIGNGVAFLLLLMIPIVGMFMAPTLGTIAATKTGMRRLS